jgi:UDP:flavonoid glycosyltransferase YjiC (YdhE family)
MRILFVTWDGAGNLPPTLALISALSARGHEVIVLGHDSQEQQITQSGGQFRRYATAPQLDQGKAQAGFDFNSWLTNFNELASSDFMEEALQLEPNVMIVDCMMGPSLSLGWSIGKKMVALVHAAYSAMSPWAEMISAADSSLCCSYEDFDKGTKFPRNITFVGPLRPIVAGRPWTRKLPDRPLVIASLSTGVQGPFQIGLLQRVCDALSALPVEALVTTGRGIAPEQLTVGSNTTVERNVDHGLTLPEASLFITHCGHGSIMASLKAGVPMLCLPPVADQPHNAELVKRLELGEILDVMAPPVVISDGVTRILADKKMQKAAKKFAKKKTYEPKIDKAVKLIEKLAR